MAFPVALTYAFVTSRLFVFERSERPIGEQYFRFFLVNMAALAQVWLVSVGVTYWIFPSVGWRYHAELIAHVIAVGSPVLTSYYAHKCSPSSELILRDRVWLNTFDVESGLAE